MRADRWGTTMARYRWLVLGVWLAVLLAAAAAYPVLQGRLTAPDYGVDGAESTRARAEAAARAPGDVHAWLTGYSPTAHDLAEVQQADVTKAESVGVPVALAVLLLALGTVVAGLVALAGAGLGWAAGHLWCDHRVHRVDRVQPSW